MPVPDVAGQVAAWRTYLSSRGSLSARDVDELEGHLRDQMDDLRGLGLSEEESFLVAIKRIGAQDQLSREFAREHSDRLWKQLVLGGAADPGAPSAAPLWRALVLALGAAAAVKAPMLFGLDLTRVPEFYLTNLSLLVLPFLAGYFVWRRRLRGPWPAILAAGFGLAATAANAYPFRVGGSTWVLNAGHTAVVLWFAVGLAYAAGDWRSLTARMDFVRFTGEWVIYYTLIALGGGVLLGLTELIFASIGLTAGTFLASWALPCGVAGAVIIAAWLVEAKQSVIENMAPVLTKVFTPLFALLLLTFLVAGLWHGSILAIDRELLIVFDLVLVVVVGLVLYAASAHDPESAPGGFDWLHLILVASAVAVDLLVLAAMVTRIGAYGVTPNRLASLGLNLVLLVNLVWSGVLLAGFVRRRRPYADLERWQTGYLPVYLGWAAIVAIAFPPVFAFA